MKLHRSLIGLALLAALAACRPGAAEYSESEAPNQLKLDDASRSFELSFARGSSHLLAADLGKLRMAVASGTLVPTDRVVVATGGPPALARARFQNVETELLRLGILATELRLANIRADQAIIESGRYVVTTPPCPNWSKQGSLDFTNTLGSNYGCATATNLGMMIANPADLAEGRPVGYPDAIPASAAVQRYVADRVVLPSSANLTSITATNTAPPSGGSSGAGTAGSQP
ncbi:MAG: hypothetical protein JO001_28980 [Alphaproteobacteria bacterium]|nr:hypothetical protein [Alphaproteobacteria bacterium]